MRFRPSGVGLFAVIAALSCAVSAFSIYRHLHAGHSSLYGSTPLLFVILINVRNLFLYWDFEPSALVQHFFWKRTEISYSEITSVTSPRKGWLEIDFGNTGIITLPGRLLINPSHTSEFIEALRTHAPHARFTIGQQAA